MKYYVYHLIDPSTDLVFYVGKGTKNRMYFHEKKVKQNVNTNRNSSLFNKIKKIHELGFSVKYKKVFETNNELNAYNFEFLEICRIGIDNLTNILITRNPNSVSENVKNGLQNSKKNKDRLEYIKSDEYREKCRLLNLGEKNPFFNKKWNDLQRKQIIEANKKPKSDLHKKNISNSLKNYKKTEDHLLNISNGLKSSAKFYNKMKSEEYRKKQSINSLGENNGNAKTYVFISPEENEFIITGGFEKFCIKNNLSRTGMLNVKNGKTISYKGWKVFEKNKE